MNILTTAILALLFTFFNAAQAACPDLTGSYICPNYGRSYGRYDIQISQSISSDGNTTYTMSYKNSRGVDIGFLIPADGIYRNIYRNQDNWRFNHSCDENGTLRDHATSDKYDIHTTYSVTANGSLTIESVTKNLETEKVKNDANICLPESMYSPYHSGNF